MLLPQLGVDPRPEIRQTQDGAVVVGARCDACGHPSFGRGPRCPACRREISPKSFGPGGVVWAATVIHISIADRQVPYQVAYVDLDDGPRVLAHLAAGPRRAAAGTRVELVGSTDEGDPLAELSS